MLLLPRFLFSGQVCHSGNLCLVAHPINVWRVGHWTPPTLYPKAAGTDPNVQRLKHIVNMARVSCEIWARVRKHIVEKSLLTWDMHAQLFSEKQASKKTCKSIQFYLNWNHVNLKYFDLGWRASFTFCAKFEIISHSEWKAVSKPAGPGNYEPAATQIKLCGFALRAFGKSGCDILDEKQSSPWPWAYKHKGDSRRSQVFSIHCCYKLEPHFMSQSLWLMHSLDARCIPKQ